MIAGFLHFSLMQKISFFEGLLQISSILELFIMLLYAHSLHQLRLKNKLGYLKK